MKTKGKEGTKWKGKEKQGKEGRKRKEGRTGGNTALSIVIPRRKGRGKDRGKDRIQE